MNGVWKLPTLHTSLGKSIITLIYLFTWNYRTLQDTKLLAVQRRTGFCGSDIQYINKINLNYLNSQLNKYAGRAHSYEKWHKGCI